MKNEFLRKILLEIGAVVLVILATAFSIKKIHQREDLALLQIDFTKVMIQAKLCFDKKGVVQDPSQGEEGKVFICSNQNITKDVFPVLKELSRRKYNYKYLSSEKCLEKHWWNFKKECAKKGEDDNKGGRINIGRGHSLVLSCNVAEGFCKGR